MNKEDIKTFFLIFFILLLIFGISVFGIKIYLNIMGGSENIKDIFHIGNVIISPEENTANKNESSTGNQNDILNQISSSGSQSSTSSKVGYYYNQLSDYSKLIYDKLKNNKENIKTGTYKIDFGTSFSKLLSNENGSDLLQKYYQTAMETFLYDNPDIFYLDATKMYINIKTTQKLFHTTYEVYIDSGNYSNYLAEGFNSRNQILNYESQIEQEVQKILAKVEGKSDYYKMQIIHDYLIDNVSYEETVSKPNIYNIYGTLVNKESVCEGYAKTFKYLMDKVGIKSIVVIGEATDSKGETQNHAWNYVYFNNAWYAIDVTWDDPVIINGGTLSNKNRYKYFLKGTNTMIKDHEESFTFIENGTVYEHPALSTNDYK